MRVALVAPGRGSYTERTLGSLDARHALVRRAEELRAESGLDPLLDLDGAQRFDSKRHLRPAHVSPLIYVISMVDAARVTSRSQVVAVCGNSMGWYTALAIAGALSFDDGFRLVQEMALLQEQGSPGGQILFPRIDEDWRPSSERAADVERALAAAGPEAFHSIHLGGYAVLAGSETGLSALQAALPRITLGKNTYPFRLMQHGPYHTPFAENVAAQGRLALAGLEFRAPVLTLVDGRGARFTPHATDVASLRAYTLGAQITTPFDFTTSVRTVLREHAPERLVLPGPGNSLGGVCGQILCAEGWRGVHTKADFERVQAGDSPLIESLGR